MMRVTALTFLIASIFVGCEIITPPVNMEDIEDGSQLDDGAVKDTIAAGSYEFGRTCDCDYTPPTIDMWVYPEIGQRVDSIYAWYDELVAEYPQYVSRENCDSVVAETGLVKPSSISHLPMYIYKFTPPKAPNASGPDVTESSVNRIKALILTGTHSEYIAIWDCLNTMRLVCRNWKEDKNLEELRWNADIYIIPCFNLYGVDNDTRTNENGVDLNRNAPTQDWCRLDDAHVYSGTEPASEYSLKLLMHYLSVLQPQVFIDHHNTNVGAGNDEGDGKNMIYVHSMDQIGLDVAGVVISQMTRKWKMRYTDTFPSVEEDPTTLYGFACKDDIPGSIAKYVYEQGIFSSIYESNSGILYKDGIYSVQNRVSNNELVTTCATEGFINYLIRTLKVCSEEIGVMHK